MIPRVLTLVLFCVGLFGLSTCKNMIKKVFSLSIMNTAVIALFVLEGSTIGLDAPLWGSLGRGPSGEFVDPVPQALMLTAIVVGVCVTALALAIVYRLYRVYGTLDIEKIREALGHE